MVLERASHAGAHVNRGWHSVVLADVHPEVVRVMDDSLRISWLVM